jgi:hypothetical protein
MYCTTSSGPHLIARAEGIQSTLQCRSTSQKSRLDGAEVPFEQMGMDVSIMQEEQQFNWAFCIPFLTTRLLCCITLKPSREVSRCSRYTVAVSRTSPTAMQSYESATTAPCRHFMVSMGILQFESSLPSHDGDYLHIPTSPTLPGKHKHE